jgi:hypothetical protein
MIEVEAGDVVFSFCDTYIKAVGIASGRAQGAPKPDFGSVGSNWAKTGWLIPVDFKEFVRPVRPKDHIAQLRQHLPTKYSPLQQTGNGQQSIYLAHVPPGMAEVLTSLIGPQYGQAIELLRGTEDDAIGEQLVETIVGRTDIGPTMKEQLIKSRRGQGIFKINVRRNEKACRVTGVTDPRNLRASHIKPWRDCSDQEKLSGCNGLLLAPHVDHLFDKGFISFTEHGDLIISSGLDRSILARWGIPQVLNVGPFNKEQAKYLEYHRDQVLKG